MNMHFILYQSLLRLAVAASWPLLAAARLGDRRPGSGWGERLGRWQPLPDGGGRPLVLVHAAGVGEARSTARLVTGLTARGARVLMTSTCRDAREAAVAIAGAEGGARLLPVDLTGLHRRVLAQVSPRAVVIVETELWPGLLWAVRAAGLPCILVSGRISDRTFPRYYRHRRPLRPFLEAFLEVQAQSETDAERFRALGVPAHRVRVGGNLKYDVAEPPPEPREVADVRRARDRGWRVVVGGSTHAGEEAALVRAVAALRSHGLRAGLVIAPRDLRRLPGVEAEIRALGPRCRPLRAEGDPGAAAAAFEAGEVVLVDRYGLLASLYGAGDVAYVGGSLVPAGGHNILEPLACGVPPVFGPHAGNAREVRAEVLRLRLGTEVSDAGELAGALGRYLRDPAAAAAVTAGAAGLFATHRGATARALAVLERTGAIGAPS